MEKYDREFLRYVSLKTRGADIPSIDPYSRFESWYQLLLSHWKKEVKKSDDMIPIGNRTLGLLEDVVSKDIFKKGLNSIFLWQLMMHREEIEGLLTREEQIQKTVTIITSPSEREHFVQEARALGDQRIDIVGDGTFGIVDLSPPFEKRKRT